jgi:hypothetical protein
MYVCTDVCLAGQLLSQHLFLARIYPEAKRSKVTLPGVPSLLDERLARLFETSARSRRSGQSAPADSNAVARDNAWHRSPTRERGDLYVQPDYTTHPLPNPAPIPPRLASFIVAQPLSDERIRPTGACRLPVPPPRPPSSDYFSIPRF